MKSLPVIVLLSFVALAAGAGLGERQIAAIREAIWRSEGGARATYAYGIKSVPYRDTAQARRMCENSIRNNYARWQAGGRTNDFIPFMAARYCPLDQNNWTRNVEWFLRNEEKPR